MSRILLFNKPYGVNSTFTSKDGLVTLAEFIDVPGVYAAGKLKLTQLDRDTLLARSQACLPKAIERMVA